MSLLLLGTRVASPPQRSLWIGLALSYFGLKTTGDPVPTCHKEHGLLLSHPRDWMLHITRGHLRAFIAEHDYDRSEQELIGAECD
jgi:hypothetical protein